MRNTIKDYISALNSCDCIEFGRINVPTDYFFVVGFNSKTNNIILSDCTSERANKSAVKRSHLYELEFDYSTTTMKVTPVKSLDTLVLIDDVNIPNVWYDVEYWWDYEIIYSELTFNDLCNELVEVEPDTRDFYTSC